MKNSNDKTKEKLQEFENFTSKEKFELNPNFTVKVMQAVEKDLQPSFFRRLYMNLIMNKKFIASASVICICFLFAYNAKETKVLSNDIVAIKSENKEILPVQESIISKSKPKKAKVARGEIHSTPVGAISSLEKALPMADGIEGHSGGATLNSNLRVRKQRVYGAVAQPVDNFNFNRDKFVYYKEQGRILTSNQATSTFSIDVDTGSYTFSRKMLELGQRPNKDAVRIEEYLNYFDYNYPKQSEKTFSLYYEIAPAAFDKGRHLLMLGLNTKEAKSERKPWNLTFLIDTSGSMNGMDRLGLVKRSLTYLVKNMRNDDKVSIVTYAGSAGVLLKGTGINEKQKIIDAIRTLGSGGSTHGSAGIHLAYKTNSENRIENGVNRVVIATDGDFNVGVQSHEALIKLIEDKRKTGVSLSAIGVGRGNYNDASLEQIANKGNGNYFYIDSFTEARKVFGKNLAGNMEIVAKDVKLQIEFNPEHVLEYRLIGYDNRKLNNEDFANDKVDAGEIGVGHSVTALYEIVFKNSEIASLVTGNQRYTKAVKKPLAKHNNELGFLKIRYKEPKESKSKLTSFPLLVEKTKQSFKNASDDFRFASAVYYLASNLKESKYSPNIEIAEIAKIAETATSEKDNRKELVEMMKNL